MMIATGYAMVDPTLLFNPTNNVSPTVTSTPSQAPEPGTNDLGEGRGTRTVSSEKDAQ